MLLQNRSLDVSEMFEDRSAGTVILQPWAESIGRLKEVDRERNEITLEVRKEIKIHLPQERVDELKDAVGEKLGVLRRGDTDGKDAYLIMGGGNDFQGSE